MKKLLLYLLLLVSFVGVQPIQAQNSSALVILFSTENGYQYETKLYLASLTTPLSKEQEVRINTFVVMLKDSLSITFLSQKFDVMYLLANETAEAGLKNLVKRSHDATAVNSPTFTQWEGFAGNGSTSYLNTNYNASTQGVTYTLNTNTIIIYSRTNSTSNGFDFGSQDAGGVQTYAYLKNTDNNIYMKTHSASNSGRLALAQSSSAGGFVFVRTASNQSKYYYNGDSLATFTLAAVSIPPHNTYIGLMNLAGTGVSTGSARQHSIFSMGINLSTIEARKVYNCIQWYMTQLGKQV